jgi:hydroxypyruvate reductase
MNLAVPKCTTMDASALMLASFHAALAAADPLRLVPPQLPAPPRGRTLVVGGGKAAASMAAALDAHWPADAPLSGLVVTRYQHGCATQRIEVIEASHPLPDGRGEAAARRMLAQCATLGRDDLLLALISGGGSSLLAAPVEGVSLDELRRVTKALLHSGATIQEINTVRKHLTCVAGGRLALAAGEARVLALIISDVAGDDPVHIASGPCAPDPGSFADAQACLARYAIAAPERVRHHFERGLAGLIDDTPKPGDARFVRTENRVIGSARASLDAAAQFFAAHGITPLILSDRIEGDAHTLAQKHAALVNSLSQHARIALISGGETTVAVRNPAGRGGRNTEFLLALALALQGRERVWALAADTDGIDGSEDNAGAIIGPDTLRRLAALRLNAATALAHNDSYTVFAALGDLVYTGPTRTNVNDYRVLLVT